MKQRLHLTLITLLFTASVTFAQSAISQEQKVTGMYSNVSYNREGGDIVGMEVFVVYSRDGYRVVYQSSEGEPSSPVVVPAKIDGNAISFSLPPPGTDPRGNFTGKIKPTEMVGTFSGNGQTVHLPRRASYWQ